MFVLDDKKNIIAVKNKDNQDIKKLYGYEIERNKVLSNTKILIEGKKANNILLYGDAGTGKSSTAVFSQEITTASDFFKSVSDRYAEIKDYEADIDITIGKSEMKGKISFKRPEMLRIDFSDPAEQVVSLTLMFSK